MKRGLDRGGWAVIGNHVYTQTGTYKVHVVVISNLAGPTAAAPINIADFFSTIVVNSVPPPVV